MQPTRHARRSLHQRRMADPYSHDATLPDLSERVAAVRAGLGYSSLLWYALLAVIAGVLGVTVFGIPAELTGLFLGVELGLVALMGLLEAARRRTIFDIATSTGREGYQRILRASVYYDWVRSLYAVAASLLLAVLAVAFFGDTLSGTVGGAAAAALPVLGNITLRDLLLLFVAFQLFRMASCRLRYRGICRLPETRDFAELNRRYLAIERRERLIRGTPVVAVVLLGFGIWHGMFGIPWEIALAAAGVSLLLLLLFSGARDLVRFHQVSPDGEIGHTGISAPLQEYPDETLNGAVFGVQKITTEPFDVRNLGRSRQAARSEKEPENTLLLTSRRLLLIHVPVAEPDPDRSRSGNQGEDCFTYLPEIRKNGAEMLEVRSFAEVTRQGIRAFSYGEILKATLKGVVITLELAGGGKASYFFMDRQDGEILKETLRKHLGEKFTG